MKKFLVILSLVLIGCGLDWGDIKVRLVHTNCRYDVSEYIYVENTGNDYWIIESRECAWDTCWICSSTYKRL